MGEYQQLTAAIQQAIKTNGAQEITGAVLQQTLVQMVQSIGGNATFAGVATPTTDPGNPDQSVFWLAFAPGTYTNFGNATVAQAAVFTNESGSWVKTDIDFSAIIGANLAQDTGTSATQAMSQKAVTFSQLGRLKKYPILNKEVCQNGRRYEQIENLILDLQISSNDGRKWAPFVFGFSDSTPIFSISFFPADESGMFADAGDSATVGFGSNKRGLLYVLGQNVKSLKGTSLTISIAVDSNAMDENVVAYTPSLLSDICWNEHWGLISLLKDLSSDFSNTTDSAITLFNDKQSRVSIFDPSRTRKELIRAAGNFLLDLEIIWDDVPTETYALCEVNYTDKKITFYDVDEEGNYTQNFYNFTVAFDKSKAGIQYVLDSPIAVHGNTGKVSAVVNWDNWSLGDSDGYKPSYLSDGIYSEHVGPIMYLRRLATVEQEISALNFLDISNGDKKIYLTSVNNQATINASVTDKTENSFVLQTSHSGSTWSCTKPPFTPTGRNYVHIRFKIKCLTPELFEQGASDKLVLWLSNGSIAYSSDGCVNLASYKDGDEVNYSFDPAYYTVYKNWTEFGVWLAVSAGTSGSTVRWQITDFEVYETEDAVNLFEGNNLKEVLDDAASKINALDETVSNLNSSDATLVSPSGNKFELSVQDDGSLVALPIIPSKGAMFGNSLIGGSGFGMAASDSQHDYFYLITEAIKALNPAYTAARLAASVTGSFEGLTSADDIDTTVQQMVGNLTGDENMVSIQLGDNVNTPEKNAVFPESSVALCKAVRAKCPNARVVWMGMWYGSSEKYQAIQNACLETGCKFISFQDLTGPEANSKIGNVQKLGSSAQRTVTGVTNVAENSSSGDTKNITVTFTVSGQSYESTLDVTDYSLQEGTLTYTSSYNIITSGGVASHPGDEGFRRISNKFLYQMGITDDSEYYSQAKGNWSE